MQSCRLYGFTHTVRNCAGATLLLLSPQLLYMIIMCNRMHNDLLPSVGVKLIYLRLFPFLNKITVDQG